MPNGTTARPSGALTLSELTLSTLWNVRGHCANRSFVDAVNRLAGAELPMRPCSSSQGTEGTLLWMGPTSWLLVRTDAAHTPFAQARDALNAVGGALFDVSSSYVGWIVRGPNAAAVLNRGCPLDFHDTAFPRGHCAQSLLGHVAALFYRPSSDPHFGVMVARSLSRDARDDLLAYMRSDGGSVGREEPFPGAD